MVRADVRRVLAILTPIAGLAFATWAQTFWTAAAVVAAPACSNVDAAGITPLTGIEVISDTLTAGHGCGTGPGEIYKYLAIVQIPSYVGGVGLANSFIAGGVYDCFSNGVFYDLCTYEGDAGTFTVTVYAFTAATWNGLVDAGVVPDSGSEDGGSLSEGGTSGDGAVADGAATDGSLSDGSVTDATTSDDGSAPVPASVVVNNVLKGLATECAVGGTPGGAVGGIIAPLLAAADWTTTCTATQQTDAPVTAACGPLVAAAASPPALAGP
jgi:hypothetical protein